MPIKNRRLKTGNIITFYVTCIDIISGNLTYLEISWIIILLTPSLPGEITLICWENVLKNWVVHYNHSTFHIICPIMVISCMIVDNWILYPTMYHSVRRKRQYTNCTKTLLLNECKQPSNLQCAYLCTLVKGNY